MKTTAEGSVAGCPVRRHPPPFLSLHIPSILLYLRLPFPPLPYSLSPPFIPPFFIFTLSFLTCIFTHPCTSLFHPFFPVSLTPDHSSPFFLSSTSTHSFTHSSTHHRPHTPPPPHSPSPPTPSPTPPLLTTTSKTRYVSGHYRDPRALLKDTPTSSQTTPTPLPLLLRPPPPVVFQIFPTPNTFFSSTPPPHIHSISSHTRIISNPRPLKSTSSRTYPIPHHVDQKMTNSLI